jgi:hypothetical protein
MPTVRQAEQAVCSCGVWTAVWVTIGSVLCALRTLLYVALSCGQVSTLHAAKYRRLRGYICALRRMKMFQQAVIWGRGKTAQTSILKPAETLCSLAGWLSGGCMVNCYHGQEQMFFMGVSCSRHGGGKVGLNGLWLSQHFCWKLRHNI